MERLTKVLVVVALVAAMGATASAGLTYGMGGDWASGAGWYLGTPAATDYAYMYRSTVSNPTTLADGDTGAILYMNFDLGGAWCPLGANGLVVNGTANVGSGSSFQGLYFGPQSVAYTPYGSTVTIGETGVLNTTQIQVNAAGGSTAYDILVAGQLNVGAIIGSYEYDVLTSDLNIIISGAGAVTVATAQVDSLLAANIIQSAETLGKTDNLDGTTTVSIVPEPATMVLLGLGALVLRRKK